MKPLYVTLDDGRTIMVLPKTEIEMDGHPILSLHYHIFRSGAKGRLPVDLDAPEFKTPDRSNPDYLGYITYEKPGMQYSYTSENDSPLERNEIAEVIEQINYVRDNPGFWGIDVS